MKKLCYVLGALMVVSLLFSCAKKTQETTSKASDEKYVIKLTHEEYANTVPDLYAKELARRVQEKSNGRITFEIFQVGQLGVGVDLIELLLTGSTQMAIVSPGNVATIVPEGQVFALHYLLPTDVKKAYDFLAQSRVTKEDLPAIYAEKNLKLFDLWPLGSSHWLSKRKIEKPADFVGLAFRTMDTPLIVKNYEAYGANPTPIGYTDVYSSLQLNMVAGVENPVGALVDMKWYEVQDYHIKSNHIMYLEGIFMNNKYFEKMPQDLKTILVDTINEMHSYAYTLQEEANAKAEKILADNLKVITLTDEAKAQFKEAAMPVRAFFRKEYSKRAAEILDKLEQELKNF